ncbi:MAG: IclR family transcriptional regulator [Candidatus Promineifilaceae bacterium]
MKTSYSGTQSVVRAIRLLKLFGGSQAVWSLTEIVGAAGLNKTTVFRMLTALESEGLLERTENGSYRLGAEMVALGGRALHANSLRQLAQPVLEQLVDLTSERTTLEVPVTNPDGTLSMLMMVEIQGKHLIGINQYVGSRLPIHATSTGKALLASMPDEERDIVMQQAFVPLTRNTLVDNASLLKELVTVRARGYAVALGELEVGLMAAGAAIFNYEGRPIAAVSIEGPLSRIDEVRLHELAGELVKSAEIISHRLGYRPI